MPIKELELKALTEADIATKIRDGNGLLGEVRHDRSGKLTVAFEYRYRIGNRHRSISAGNWPRDSLKAIRNRRDAFRVDVAQGRDPAELKKTAKLATQAADAEARADAQAKLDAIAAASRRMTVTDLLDRWEKLALVSRKDKGREVRRMFEKDVLPALGLLAVADVRKGDIAAMLDRIRERGVGRMVNLMLSQVRQMFRFAVARDWIEADPTASLKKADFGGKEVERDRVLSEDEIRDLAQCLPEAKFSATTEAAIWVMLATCCRIGEISKAKWSDVDFDARRWKIPATNSKNKREHIVALSDFAMKWFQKLHASRLSNEWVLPAKNITPSGTETHVNEKSISKQVHDRQRTTPMKGRSKCVSVLLLSGGEWTPHDLRRSGATLMGELGVNDDVIERCLNHVEANRMKRTYQRQKAESAKMEAWRLLGERLELLINPPDNVLTLNRSAA